MSAREAASAEVLSPAHAEEVVNSLRMGIPPRRFASTYSAGWSDFLSNVRKRHLSRVGTAGKMRFISGSWGSGKTHLLRLLAEEAYAVDYLVTTVTLSKDEAPFNKFELVFSRIIRQLTSPEMYAAGDLSLATPFGETLRRSLLRAQQAEEPIRTTYNRESTRLMENEGIDIDFRRAVCRYWETFTASVEDDPESSVQEIRGQLLQWFTGEGSIATYRKQYGLIKTITKENAHLMLQSLARFAQHVGYGGIMVLLDESEMQTSVMSRSTLKQAHTNLLHLINGIDESAGLFLIYAATPDFFDDPKHGIQQFGALAMRIGQPPELAPRALDRVWNVDGVEHAPEDFRRAANQLRELYLTMEPEDEELLPSRDELDRFVDEVVRNHPKYGSVSVWRMLVTAVIREFDNRIEGSAPRDGAQAHEDTMAEFRD